MKKYPVVTLCGSTRFKDDFMQIQKELTLKGYIVISVGLFGHSGDAEVWEGMDENSLTATKMMLDDMHKSKIDMADEIFVVNPGGHIGDSTWSEICYAYMTGKKINSLVPIDIKKVAGKVQRHIRLAEMLAARQYDVYSHLDSDYPSEDVLLKDMDMVVIRKGKSTTVDPWVPEDSSVPTCDDPFPCHADRNSGYDPFSVYGKINMARFVEEILMRSKAQAAEKPSREKIEEDVKWYCRELNMPLPQGFPDEMSDGEMQDWLMCWHEFDPCPDV